MNQDRKTQLTMVTGFLILSYIFNAEWLGYFALVLSIVFLTSKYLSSKILIAWWKLAHVLGWINSRILLSVIFFIFLFPIATLSKAFTKDPLKLKWKKYKSTFEERNHVFQNSDLENPW